MNKNDSFFKRFQDFEPVVLRKKTTSTSYSNQKSKSNIHINTKSSLDNDNDIVPIPKYTSEQINKIKEGRNALNLTQEQLTRKINSSLPKDFINKIESGVTPFNQQTYKTILRNLNVKS